MRRRLFIAGAVAATISPFASEAEPARKRPLIGVCYAERNEAQMWAFLEGIRALGYEDGSFDLVNRFADNDLTRLPALASELVALRPDVILAQEPASSLAVSKATSAIPIVGAILNEPVQAGLAQSLSRPGANLTGILSAVPGMMGKQIDIARELVPHIDTLGILLNPASPADLVQRDDFTAAAQAIGLKTVVAEAHIESEIEGAFKRLERSRIQALVLVKDALFRTQASYVAQLAAAAQLPMIAGAPQWVGAGALVSYGVDTVQNFRRAAYLVDRILKGANPGDLPIEFPTKIDLAINLKTAKSLGIAIPQSLLVQADQVIE